MIEVQQGPGIDVNTLADDTLHDWIENITIAKVTVSGVKQIRVTHPDLACQINETNYIIPAATQIVNTADVNAFTTYHCYYDFTTGSPVWTATTVDPHLSATIIDHICVRLIRFKSVADVATIEFVQRQLTSHNQLVGQIGRYSYITPPVYISGFAPTFNLSIGTLSVEEGKYRRVIGDIRTRVAITDGVLYEPAVDIARANFALIAKYADGSAITATKYIKLLVGILANADSDYDFIVNIQGKPSTEYTTALEAWADSERKASGGFSATRRSAVIPLAWVVMKVGDASTITYADIRETGLVIASGGNTGVTDHGGLTGLTDYVDHPGLLQRDGSNAITGNVPVDNGITIDGVDISAHAADTEAHHATVTLAASVAALMDLTGQAISLDTQATKKVLAGPVSGVDATPTFRQLAAADISDFDAAALLAAPAVSLAASARL
jgi:hypothetical protein